ncbi:hypothetical protein FACS189445_0290 [Spirochaetia bacterium]|nr:hypothetical protein FACS189445_0290 [Spirochaetia bacterium]
MLTPGIDRPPIISLGRQTSPLADKKYSFNSVEQNPVMKEWEALMGSEHAQHEHWHIHYAGHAHK